MYLFGRIGALVLRGAREQAFRSAFMWNTVEPFEMTADQAFMVALAMCGNAGQVSIIEQTGYQAFYEAVDAAYSLNYPLDILVSACPYPEVVGEILETVAEGIWEAAMEAYAEFFGSDADEGDFEGGDEGYEDW